MSINLNDIITYGQATFKVVKIATSEDIGYIQNQLDLVTYDYVPIGVIFPFCGNTIPNSYLLCDGSAISRTTYNKLFNVVGTTYGAGDNSTTFNVPNFTDKFMEGNSIAGINKDAGLPNITGWATVGVNKYRNSSGTASGSLAFTDAYGGDGDANGSTCVYGRKMTLNATSSSSIYGNSSTVQPSAVTVRFLIKAFNA